MFLASNLKWLCPSFRLRSFARPLAPSVTSSPPRREGTAHRQNLYTQTPDSPHSCGRLVFKAIVEDLISVYLWY